MGIYMSTDIIFLSNQKKDLLKLKDFILELKTNSGIKTDYGKNWIGHLAFNLCKKKGLSYEESKKIVCHSSTYACKGFFESLEFDEDEGYLRVITETEYKSASAIFKEVLALSGLKNIDLYWLDFYENGEMETNDSEHIVFKDHYYIDHDYDPDFMKVAPEPGTYTKEEARKFFINLLTSKYIHQDYALTQEEAEKLTTDQLFVRLDDAKFYDDEKNEFFLVIKETKEADSMYLPGIV